ncbi:MAG: DUF1592 domain-containing protein [bacterium]|nr:DUF1592 domain-containing protein [bacterium]
MDAGLSNLETFAYDLLRVTDRQHPEQSPLLLKPVSEEEHTGGELIAPGSHEEQLLRRWVLHLSSLSDQQVQDAQARIRPEIIPRLATRRLTHAQYNNAVQDLLGDRTKPANRFTEEDFVRGFKNQVDGQIISPLLAEAYSKSAERLASVAFRGGDRLGLVPDADLAGNEELRASAFIQDFGLRVFRRPMTAAEVDNYRRLHRACSQTEGSFRSGCRAVVEAMLQSPHFLMQVERGPGNAYEQFERASRLSFFLWNTTPSPELLAAAAEGRLSTHNELADWAERMLDDPRCRDSMDEFLAQWLRFDRVLTATRDRRFSKFNSNVAMAMVEETRRLFHHLAWQDRNFLEFYTADYTFIDSNLAALYELPAPAEAFQRVEYAAESGRAGVLGHGSFLVATSKPAETSPTERGLFVRTQFLSHEVPAPPPGVTTSLPEITKERPMTNRERLELHLNSDACAGCHRLIDPIGLGLEQYDPIGAFQAQMQIREDGETLALELDTQAHIQGIVNSSFSNPRELGRVLANSTAGQRAIVKQLFRYAFGRRETSADSPEIDRLFDRFRDSDFRFRELLLALVTSDLFFQPSP